VGLDSGFSALEMILRALGVGPGDEVITQANTFIATVSAIQQAGATPVLIDCREDGSADLEQARAAIGPRTRVLMPVHLFGRLTDAQAWAQLAAEHHLELVEDACQAHGAHADGRRAGTFGKAGAFSFYPGKNLGAFGDAGAVVTDDAELASWIRDASNYGQASKYEHRVTPLNRRLDSLQAAVLGVKLRRLEEWNQRRISFADAYREQLQDLPLELPAGDGSGSHVYHLFPILVDDQAGLLGHLAASEIQAGIHYPQAVHQVPVLGLGYAASAFPVASRRAARMVSLPMHPHLGFEGVERVAAAVRQFLQA
jgi:dTDP-4-amino-4,6-dideoxygalactose transaminase